MRKAIFVVSMMTVLCYSSLYSQIEGDIELNQQHLDILVRSAIDNSPRMDRADISIQEISLAKRRHTNSWFKFISIGGNLNELSIRQFGSSSEDNNIFFPRYNVGLHFPLSAFGEQVTSRKKIAFEELKANSEKEELERKLKEEVTRKYVLYLKEKKILNIRKTLHEYLNADFKVIEQNFTEGRVALEEYDAKRRQLYTSMATVLEAESLYLMAKTELEIIANNDLEALGIE